MMVTSRGTGGRAVSHQYTGVTARYSGPGCSLLRKPAPGPESYHPPAFVMQFPADPLRGWGMRAASWRGCGAGSSRASCRPSGPPCRCNGACSSPEARPGRAGVRWGVAKRKHAVAVPEGFRPAHVELERAARHGRIDLQPAEGSGGKANSGRLLSGPCSCAWPASRAWLVRRQCSRERRLATVRLT